MTLDCARQMLSDGWNAECRKRSGIAAARTSAPADVLPRAFHAHGPPERSRARIWPPNGGPLYWPRLMGRLLVRRSATAIGIYSSVVFGLLGDGRGLARAALAAGVGRLLDGHLRDRLPPVVLRSDRRGGARQVRLPLRHPRGLGPPARALLGRAAREARRLAPRRARPARLSRPSPRRGCACRSSSRPGSRSASRSRGSPGSRSTSAAATTCAPRSRRGRCCSASPACSSARTSGSRRRLRGVLVAQVVATALGRRRGPARVPALPGRAAAPARRRPAGDPALRRPVEHGDGRRLAPHRPRAAPARRRDGDGAGRPLQGRAGAADGVLGALLARADGAADRADARLGAGPPVGRAARRAPLHARGARAVAPSPCRCC